MPKTERPASDLVLNYRECVRTVWNGYFRKFPDGWHEFINVNHELLVSMVLVQAFDGYGYGEAKPALVRVRPLFGPSGVRIMYAHERRGDCGVSWEWKERQLSDAPIEMAFIEFFDWSTDGIRDLEFARVKVESCSEAPELVGADVLLPALGCDYFVIQNEATVQV